MPSLGKTKYCGKAQLSAVRIAVFPFSVTHLAISCILSCPSKEQFMLGKERALWFAGLVVDLNTLGFPESL